jgi:transposase
MNKTISKRQQRLEERRFKAAALFRRGKTQAEVARALRVSPEAARLWHSAWKAGGKKNLTSKGKPGKDPALTAADKRTIERALDRGPEKNGFATPVWTLERIRIVIRREAGIAYHPGHVWKVMQDMGWTCQKPKTPAKERDEAAIRQWVEETWPGLKKGEVIILP